MRGGVDIPRFFDAFSPALGEGQRRLENAAESVQAYSMKTLVLLMGACIGIIASAQAANGPSLDYLEKNAQTHPAKLACRLG